MNITRALIEFHLIKTHSSKKMNDGGENGLNF